MTKKDLSGNNVSNNSNDLSNNDISNNNLLDSDTSDDELSDILDEKLKYNYLNDEDKEYSDDFELDQEDNVSSTENNNPESNYLKNILEVDELIKIVDEMYLLEKNLKPILNP